MSVVEATEEDKGISLVREITNCLMESSFAKLRADCYLESDKLAMLNSFGEVESYSMAPDLSLMHNSSSQLLSTAKFYKLRIIVLVFLNRLSPEMGFLFIAGKLLATFLVAGIWKAAKQFAAFEKSDVC